jgi:hypothetical protein
MGIMPYYQNEFLQREMSEESQKTVTQPTLTIRMSGLECSTLNFIKDYLVALSEYIKGKTKISI